MNLTGKKYSLLPTNKVSPDGQQLFQIIAARDMFSIQVRKGSLGGHVTGPDNLSQDGTCWIDEGCAAYGNAVVDGDALLRNGSTIADNVVVTGNSYINASHLKGNIVVEGFSFTTLEGVTLAGDLVFNGTSISKPPKLDTAVRPTLNTQAEPGAFPKPQNDA